MNYKYQNRLPFSKNLRINVQLKPLIVGVRYEKKKNIIFRASRKLQSDRILNDRAAATVLL